MAYMNRGRRVWRDDPGPGGFGAGFGAEELSTKSLFIQSKKFYVDVKQNKRGKFVKISEVAPTGQKMRLIMDMGSANEFHDRLTEFCEFYSSLGPAKWDRSRMGVDEGKLKSEVIFREDRRYYLDLKENHRGRFLKVSMSLPNFERTQIVIPAQGMIDIRDALTDALHQFGGENSSSTKNGDMANRKPPAATASIPDEQESITLSSDSDCLTLDGKTFSFQVGENPRGQFIRISEISPNFRTAITIPSQSWEKFIEMAERATMGNKSVPN